jgi:hypothetical protein
LLDGDQKLDLNVQIDQIYKRTALEAFQYGRESFFNLEKKVQKIWGA